MRRFLLYSFLLIVVLLLAVAGAHPWLLAWAGPIVAQRFGFEVSHVEVQGYDYLVLDGVRGVVGGTMIEVQRARVVSPVRYWLRLQHPERLQEPLVDASGVRVDVQANPEPSEEPSATPPEVGELVGQIAEYLDQWAPWIQIDDGYLRVRSVAFALPTVRWRQGELVARGHYEPWGTAIALDARPLGHYHITAAGVPQAGEVELDMDVELSSNLLRLTGDTSGAMGKAQFDLSLKDSWTPAEAIVRAPKLELPGALVGQPELGIVHTDASAAWNGTQWAVDVDASANWTTGDQPPLPVEVKIVALGTPGTASINEFKVRVPQGRVELLMPVELQREPPFLVSDGAAMGITLHTDKVGLEQIPSPLTGAFTVQLDPADDGGPPALRFKGRTSTVGQFHGRDVQLDLDGRLDWPLLHLQKLDVDLGLQSNLHVEAALDMEQQRILASEGTLRMSQAWMRQLLPDTLSVNELAVDFTAQGTVPDVDYEAKVFLDAPRIRNAGADRLNLTLKGQGLHSLEGTAVAWQRGRQTAAMEWSVTGSLPETGEALALETRMKLGAVLPQGDLGIELWATMDKPGTSIGRLSISADNAVLFGAKGFVPIALIATETGVQPYIPSDGAVNLTFGGELTHELRLFIEEALGIQLGTIAMEGRLKGPIDDTEGYIQAHADRIVLPEVQGGVQPILEDLTLDLELTPHAIDLKRLSLRLNGQPMEATAHLPAPRGWVDAMRDAPQDILSQASGTFVSEDYPLGILDRLMPGMFSETGTLTARVQLFPGLKLQGGIQVKQIRSRPLTSTATLTVASLSLDFEDRQVLIREFDGQLGRQKLELTGGLDFTQLDSPAVGVRLRGERLPLILSDDLVLRGDADIEFTMPAGQPAKIEGSLLLREGLVLRDLQGLTASGPSGAPSRPPYFSYGEEPFDDWQLNLKVQGERFLRIETPVFSGRVSADFNLTGRLRDPLLLGEATVDTGVARFPFGTLRMQDGRAFITREDPHQLKLDLQAEGGSAGYTIEMNVAGTADEPEVTFTSTPPLRQEEVLLLLTTGTLPQDGGLGRSQAQQLALYLGQGLFRDLLGPGSGEGIADKLTVESGRELSEEGRETYNIQYELNNKLSVEGGYDVYDQYNIGVRWNVYSK